MNTNILDRKINKASGYFLYLKLAIFILIIAAVLIAMQIAGVFSGSKDEEIFRLATTGITMFSVLVIGWTFFLILKKKNYTSLLKVDVEEVAEIVEDTSCFVLNTATFALGHKYAYFYGELIRTPRKLICIKYEEITRAEFTKWRSNEQILFYDKHGTG